MLVLFSKQILTNAFYEEGGSLKLIEDILPLSNKSPFVATLPYDGLKIEHINV